MKKSFCLILAVFVLAASYGQKTIHDPNVEPRNVKGFHAIEVSHGIDLYLSQGDEAVAVSAGEAAVRDHIKTEVKNGVLKIYFESQGLKFNLRGRSLKAYVSYKTLDRLSGSGGADISVEGNLQSDKLSIELSGGSDFKGSVKTGELAISQSGGSDANITGSATAASIQASGGSDFNGFDLVTDQCTIDASGGSDIEITVNREISAEASGASDISWKGNASVRKARASGAGSVSHKS